MDKTGTSRFSMPSIPLEDVDMRDATPVTRNHDSQLKKPMRQMLIEFGDGKLGNKKPLRNPISRDDPARKSMAEIAAETWRLLPGLLVTRPDVRTEGHLVQHEDLDARFCPRLPPVKIRVVCSDTVDAALDLQSKGPSSSRKPVIILNMANANSPGGGWRHGAKAQEESICYRTSLSLTLKKDYYPIPDLAVVYSPRVLVIRDGETNNHELVDCTEPRKLDVISVVSSAAVERPRLRTDAKAGSKTWADPRDKRMMERKMRNILRTAIRRRHRQIVLGAFGCGVFANPNNEVAAMWKAILQEPEFSGGWWEDVVFAVLGSAKSDSNFTVFQQVLDGRVLS